MAYTNASQGAAGGPWVRKIKKFLRVSKRFFCFLTILHCFFFFQHDSCMCFCLKLLRVPYLPLPTHDLHSYCSPPELCLLPPCMHSRTWTLIPLLSLRTWRKRFSILGRVLILILLVISGIHPRPGPFWNSFRRLCGFIASAEGDPPHQQRRSSLHQQRRRSLYQQRRRSLHQ